ncbi:reverse transcriptase domain-containing protein [Tanacetum coccineum]
MNKKDFRWNQEAEEAFQELKLHLQSLPDLTVLIDKETLILYLAVFQETISSVLMQERNNVQRPIYFVTETPRNNSSIEHGGAKTSRLRFQEKTPIWTLYIDGASSNEVSGAGVILTDPDGKEIAYALRFEFSTSNNEVTYEALIAVRLEVHHLQVFSDSLLITTQVKGAYEAREGSMKHYLVKVQILKEKFKIFSITHIPRLKKLMCRHFNTEPTTINIVGESDTTWMDPIIDYLRDGKLLEDPMSARKIMIKAPQYFLKQCILYRKGYFSTMVAMHRP